MNRHAAILAIALIVLPALGSVHAGDEVRLTGWITCEYCGKANANAAGKDCVLACAEKGARLLLFSGERLYRLSGQDLARKHVGHRVVVTGKLQDDGTLRVKRIQKDQPAEDQPTG